MRCLHMHVSKLRRNDVPLVTISKYCSFQELIYKTYDDGTVQFLYLLKLQKLYNELNFNLLQ